MTPVDISEHALSLPEQDRLALARLLIESFSTDRQAILAALAEADDDIRNGRVASHDEVKRRLRVWTSR